MFLKEKKKHWGVESCAVVVVAPAAAAAVVLEAKGPEIWEQGEQGQQFLAVSWTGLVPCTIACTT